MPSPDLPPVSNAERVADGNAWAELMRGNLAGLLEYIRSDFPIRPGSYIAEFLEEALTGTGEFELRLSAKGRGARPQFQRWDAMDRRVRIGWFIEARIKRGLRFDEAIADAVGEFGIGRKSAERELTYFRSCWDKCEVKGGAEPKEITDPELLDFSSSWDVILANYPNG